MYIQGVAGLLGQTSARGTKNKKIIFFSSMGKCQIVFTFQDVRVCKILQF